jgi:hypothetical protein
MNFELNPFEIAGAPGLAPIKQITVHSNLNWFDVPAEPLTGEAVLLNIDANVMPALMVFAAGQGDSVPSFQLLSKYHIPNIDISQVTGLQDQLILGVKTFVSLTPHLSVTHNASGDYAIQAILGNTGTTLAVGNDARFPASVTGLRKGAGNGSLDTPAVARSDYWDTSEFVQSGASHAKGLVPDPGATAGTTRFLCEDKLWKVPPGSGTVTSIGITVPSDLLAVSPASITSAGTFAFTKPTQAANLIYAGPATGAAAAPTFRAHVYADLSALVGTSASTLAAGNDTRFPASVTGLRKSAGAGSTDVAAVLKTDYWNADVFTPAGPLHSIGLVPDPGPDGSAIKFLTNLGTWATPGLTGSISNSDMATMPANTLKGNPTGSTSSPTDVTPKIARSASLLNVESITSVSNIDYTCLPADRYVVTTAGFTAPHAVYLPLANSVNAGHVITYSDSVGTLTSANYWAIKKQGADYIGGATTDVVLQSPYASATFMSDGVSRWQPINITPSVRRRVFTSSTTYTAPAGCKAIYVEGVGGGGGGGGCKLSGTGTSGAAGGGGGGGYFAGYLAVSGGVSSYTLTIGGGGAAGSAAGGNGGTGGQTSFGGWYASGGIGGAGYAGAGTIGPLLGGSAGTGGIGSGPEVIAWGSSGGRGIIMAQSWCDSGSGGASQMGGSVQGVGANADGYNGRPFGGGGSGAAAANTTGQNGGAGYQGQILITEYY